MSAAAVFASQFAPGEARMRRPRNAQRLARKMCAWGFTFFALKGLAWLLLPVMAMYFA
jgi:hypothetical protein